MRLIRLAVCLLILASALHAAASADAQGASLHGQVHDPTNASIAGADVTLRADTQVSPVRHARTNAQGSYEFSGLSPGRYQLQVFAQGFGNYQRSNIDISLPDATFTADVSLSLSSASSTVTVTESPFVQETVGQIGPFTAMSLQNTPYSINIESSGLIESIQASTVDQLWRLSPFVQNPVPQTRNGSGLGYIRGFSTAVQREDGLYTAFPVIDLEDKENVEVLLGQSGFFYGVNPPGGLVNYELKRPTATRFNTVTAGSYGGSSIYGHGDFAGPIGPHDVFGYRLNLIGQNGSTAIQKQNIRRGLAGGALDWHVSKAALLQIDSSRSAYRVDGSPSIWQLDSDQPVPVAPASSLLYGQTFDFDTYATNKSAARGLWQLPHGFTLRGGVNRVGYQREDLYTNNVIEPDDTYTSIVLPFAPRNITSYGGQSFLDWRTARGRMKNLFTFGYDGNIYRERRHQDQSAVITLGTRIPYPQQVFFSRPAYQVGLKPSITFSRTINRNMILADSLDLGQHWTIVGGTAHATVVQQNFSLATALQSALYDDSKWTPSVSVIYKPATQISTYFTYIQGLSQGGTAPDTATNAGVALPPVSTVQYEVGAKMTVERALLTLALFSIDEPFQYVDPTDNVYKQAGRERHKGIELGVTGQIYHGLNLYGGLTLLDPRVEDNPASPIIENSRPPGVAKQLYKLTADYDVPHLRGLGVTGSIVYTGRSPADQPNRYYVPAFTTGDLGLRYQWTIHEQPLTFRANVTNLTNKSYWLASLFGSNLYTGDPRSVAASVSTSF